LHHRAEVRRRHLHRGLRRRAEVSAGGLRRRQQDVGRRLQLERRGRDRVAQAAPPTSLVIPILYRDMLYANTTTPGPGHPDFNNPLTDGNGAHTGLVQTTLGSDGEPLWASNNGSPNTASLTNARDYCWWYHDSGCTSVS